MFFYQRSPNFRLYSPKQYNLSRKYTYRPQPQNLRYPRPDRSALCKLSTTRRLHFIPHDAVQTMCALHVTHAVQSEQPVIGGARTYFNGEVRSCALRVPRFDGEGFQQLVVRLLPKAGQLFAEERGSYHPPAIDGLSPETKTESLAEVMVMFSAGSRLAVERVVRKFRVLETVEDSGGGLQGQEDLLSTTASCDRLCYWCSTAQNWAHTACKYLHTSLHHNFSYEHV